MHVASLELCKELYELSGWDDCDNWASHKDMAFISDDTFLEMNPKWQKEAPAYDLGYLLRKLPAAITPAVDLKKVAIKDMGTYFLYIQKSHDGAVASYNKVQNSLATLYIKSADTPENALCALAIELFKQKILTREG